MATTHFSNQWTTSAKGSTSYEPLRRRYFNAQVPDYLPAIIHVPRTTQDVADIIYQASLSKQKVGVRSGGHLFPCTSLIDDGILIDTINLNRDIGYDPVSKVISFSPAEQGRTLAPFLDKIGRFFPFGHSPSVGVGGFLLAGGQGWFMRSWGCTSDSWILKMEIVLPDGKTVEASYEQNSDLFWAARGSGQGFFGVVTRIHARTIPARTLYETTKVFDATNHCEELLHWVFERNDGTPKHAVETALATFYPNRSAEPVCDEVNDKRLFMAVNSLAYADSPTEAQVLVSRYTDVPAELRNVMVADIPVHETTWAELFESQNALNPAGNGQRWQCDSILNDPKADRSTLIQAILPAMSDLPTRRSIGCIYIGDYHPDEDESAVSLPQQYCISTMTCWQDPNQDSKMRKWMYDVYSKLDHVSVGQYIADLDVNHRVTKVMTDSALRKWLTIRAKYDPDEMFVGYRGVASTLDHELTTSTISSSMANQS